MELFVLVCNGHYAKIRMNLCITYVHQLTKDDSKDVYTYICGRHFICDLRRVCAFLLRENPFLSE